MLVLMVTDCSTTRSNQQLPRYAAFSCRLNPYAGRCSAAGADINSGAASLFTDAVMED
jgi:hypothetical protein